MIDPEVVGPELIKHFRDVTPEEFRKNLERYGILKRFQPKKSVRQSRTRAKAVARQKP